MTRRARRAVAMGLAGAALMGGCAGCPLPIGRIRLPDCPGPLVSTQALPAGDFRVREQVRVTGSGVDLGLDVVAEKRGDRLVVVALSVFGTQLFTVTQRGEEVEFAAPLRHGLPVPPRNLLRDLHAARFADPAAPARAVVERPDCGYTAVFVRVEHRPLR